MSEVRRDETIPSQIIEYVVGNGKSNFVVDIINIAGTDMHRRQRTIPFLVE